MSDTHQPPDDRLLPPPLETIEQRIERGREIDRAYDNAIVPFPARFGIPASCVGSVGRDHDHLVAGGYRCTAYAYRSAGGEVLQYVLRFDHRNNRRTTGK